MLRLVSAAGRMALREARLLPLRAAVALGSAGLGEPPKPDRLWKAFALVMPVAAATYWVIPQLTWVVSPSIDAWALQPAPGPIARGDYVSFWLVNPLAGPKPVHVTKQALCLSGQRLREVERPSRTRPRHEDGWYYCDGRLLGVSKPFGRQGQRLDHLRWGSRIVPAGFIYVGSHHPDGFDSRYYGPIAISRLTRMERVL